MPPSFRDFRVFRGSCSLVSIAALPRWGHPCPSVKSVVESDVQSEMFVEAVRWKAQPPGLR